MASRNETAKGAAKAALRGLGGLVVFLFIVSGFINVLALTGSFYMLQIYDRALVSGSVPTLLALSALAIGLYVFQGFFDIIRTQVLVRIGARIDRRLAPVAHKVAVDMPRFGYSTAEALERGRDVDTLRSFFGSQGPIALFDLPWVPLFLGFVYFLHPTLGALTIAGAVVLTIIAIVTEVLTRRGSQEMHESSVQRGAIADSNARNAEVLKAMGFASRAVERYAAANERHLEIQTRMSDISGSFGAISRVLRMLLQSAVLGVAAYLTIMGQLSAGAIIACTIAASRAMAPIDMAIGNWKHIVAARGSWHRVRDTVAVMSNLATPMQLPRPERTLKVEGITVAAPASGRVLLSDVSFELKAGDALGIIGPSGGGKSTLARVLTAVWPPLRGSVRLDDADLSQWSDADRGRHVGYLPQDVALLDATVEENIARLDTSPEPMAVVAAARAAAVHDMIVRLPEGYQTALGPMGAAISGGQRQRLGLARALYLDPFVVVLDEPNASLDPEGEEALTAAISDIRKRGGIAIVIAHRPSALQVCNLVGIIQKGKLTAFGPKETILAPKASPSVTPPAPATPVAPAVATEPNVDLRETIAGLRESAARREKARAGR
jgi:ATP-binding cassette subfamily C protein